MNKSYTHTPPSRTEVLVVGAGLAGLSAAGILARDGFDVHVVEAGDAVGGRVRTDEHEGFLLDRGFQVLLTAYEEIGRQIDVDALDLRAFKPGSLVWKTQGMQRLSDPVRDPAGALAAASAQVGTMRDKLKVATLRHSLLGKTDEECFDGPIRSTQAELEAFGFSKDFIDSFFRPFLGGVFLEKELETDARLFRYYFRCFARGDAALPARGMQHFPELLAEPIHDRVTLNSPVVSVEPRQVVLANGRSIAADAVILAADGVSASALASAPAPAFKGTVTAYFGAPEAPTDEAMLVLDGEGDGPANHVAVVSNVASEYAPAGAHLISVSSVDAVGIDPNDFAAAAMPQMRQWFGSSVDRWEHLRSYHVPHALPRHPPGHLPLGTPAPRGDDLVVCGDFTDFGAIQGALASGRRAAQTVSLRLGSSTDS